ncbi:hypothetical protein EV294_101350 [Paenibacillus sp. BK033]|uniref:hypothetical protein n=1 Tax=Paenibacillus sp. BK033 TaxID=2512133 RepID=UPI0010D75F45|nr:hypothetical protein [Paenibacillus sp. BK033]TCN00900.1 hypothetical protein EV294_101350 [Paenibacillus sp. BK033]
MNWRKATKQQLREIAFNDDRASMTDKAAAEAELMRRQNKRLAKLGRVSERRLFAK